MANYKFIAYDIDGRSTDSGFTYKNYKEVFKMVTETILPMSIVAKVEITCDGKIIEELTKDEKMTEKIKISKELNDWFEKNKTMSREVTRYDYQFGDLIFDELIEIFGEVDINKEMEAVRAFGYVSNSRTAHLWLILNQDKWEVEEEKQYFIRIPETDGSHAYLKKERGLVFNSNPPFDESYKWTEEEVNADEIASKLKAFMEEV